MNKKIKKHNKSKLYPHNKWGRELKKHIKMKTTPYFVNSLLPLFS